MGEGPDVGHVPAASGDEVEEIRGEIEETRADLSETIDAIQGKLSPDNLKEEAKSKAQEATLQAKDRLREVATAKAQDARRQPDRSSNRRLSRPVPPLSKGFGAQPRERRRVSGKTRSRLR